MKKFRVWVNGEMIYPETKNKPCDWIIDMQGKLHSFPNRYDIVYDPTKWEGAISMEYTGFNATCYPIYQSDIVRDSFGKVGRIIRDTSKECWIVEYSCGCRHLLSDYVTTTELENIGNIYQHPDWENWEAEKKTPKPTIL